VAPAVAAFPQYRYALLGHLLHTKLQHWDRDVRVLAAKVRPNTVPLAECNIPLPSISPPHHHHRHSVQSLARLCHLDAGWAVETALPTLLPLTLSTDLYTRHGAILGVAEVVLALARVPAKLPPALADQVRNVVVKAEQALAYRGRGGEMVRAAMCHLIACQCAADHALSRKAALRMLQTVDECLRHPNDAIQAAALAALRALTHHALCNPDPAALDRLPRAYVTRLTTDDNPAVRRGMALALGALPRGVLCGGGAAGLDAVLDALIMATKQERQAAKRDAETRRNAAMALADVVITASLGKRGVLTLSPHAGGETGRVAASASVEAPHRPTYKSPEGADAAPAAGGGRIAALRAAKAAGAGGKVAAPATAGAAAPAKPDVTTATRPRGETWLTVGEVYDGLTAEQFARAWGALVAATHDYAIDNRGDVGSWVRKAALEGLERIAVHVLTGAWVRQRVAALHTALSTPSPEIGAFAACAGLDQLWCPAIAAAAVHQLSAVAVAVGTAAAAASAGAGGGAGGSEAAVTGGFTAGISGYGAGTRLVAAAPHELPDAVVTSRGVVTGTIVDSVYGCGRLQRIVAGGAIGEVAFQPGSLGAACFPYAMACVPVAALRPLLLLAPTPSPSPATAVARWLSLAPSRWQDGSGSAPTAATAAIRLIAETEDTLAWLSAEGVVEMMGCFLRTASEKLDLLRGMAGEALCRIVHVPWPLPALPHLRHAAHLAATFPAPHAVVVARQAGDAVMSVCTSTTAALNPAAASLPLVQRALEAAMGRGLSWHVLTTASVGAVGADAETGEDGVDTTAEDGGTAPGPDAPLDSATPAVSVEDSSPLPASPAPSPTAHASVQWAIPHQSFPRLAPLLAHPEYAPALLEGLVTSVGGLSESVVRHSAAAVCAWATEVRKSTTNALSAGGGSSSPLGTVATALLAMLRPRRLQPWDELVEGGEWAVVGGGGGE